MITFVTEELVPPRAPNFGGLWESAVRLSKRHLYAAVKDQALNLVEYSNVFRRIEAVLNSRPLCYRSDALYSQFGSVRWELGVT